MREEDPKEKPVSLALTRDAAPASPLSDIEAVYREHGKRVFRVALRVTGSPEDAEDVLQAVFLRLSDSGAPEGLWENPGAYLHRTAVNAAIDLMRSKKPGRDLPIEEVRMSARKDPSPGPAEVHANAELKARVRTALADLSPRSAEIFALRYFEGYGNKEIARLVGTSESAVAVMLHRARNRVRDALAPAAGDRS